MTTSSRHLRARVALSALTLLLSLAPVTWGALSPTPDQRRATELVTHFMATHHYKRAVLDDVLSAKVLDRYLESLDPTRSYFVQADVDSFGQFRYRLDDALREARLEPAFSIFDTYQKRVEERVRYAQSLLDAGFDFKKDEQYGFDRSKAPWARDRAELDEIWRKRVKNDYLSLRLAGKKESEIVETLRKRYEYQGKRTQQFNATDVYQVFLNAYTQSVEPHTAYFSPRTSENFKINMRLSLEGIGVVLQGEDEYTVVRRIVPGGPADKSKRFKIGDRIVGVGQGRDAEMVDIIGWRLDDVVDLIRGPAGSEVRLQLLDKDAASEGPARTVVLKRNKIDLEEQAARTDTIELSEGVRPLRIGVIHLSTFYLDFDARARGDEDYRSTTRDVRHLIDELREKSVDGIIIDLRGNGGGSLTEATELTGLFIKSGPVVQVRDATGRIEVNEDPDPAVAYSGPLAVLVDRHSASASEIFAGAIQDYRRGLVIGEPTFGKGTVQALIDLDRYAPHGSDGLGQLKVTVAQFFRVSGASTQHKGVVPDIELASTADSDEEGERALDNALPWAEVRPAKFAPGASADDILSEVRTRHEKRARVDPAFRILMEEVEASRAAQEKHSISLSEERRKVERETLEKQRLDRENRLRAVLGLEAEPASKAVADESSDELAEDEYDPRRDVVLHEAAHILGDEIELLRPASKPLQAAQLGTATAPPAP